MKIKKITKFTSYLLIFIILVILFMGIFKLCPPNGPWPQPPWCSQRPSFSDLFDKQVILTNVNMGEIPLIKSSELNKLNVHGIGWQGFSVENIGFQSGSWNFVNTANKNGLPVISSMNLVYLIRNNPIEFVDTAAIDLYGNPIDLSSIKETQGIVHGSYYRNILNSDYKSMLIKDAKKNIDAGVEGIVFDDGGSVSGLIYKEGGSFDEYSIFGFREYLKNKYSSKELLKLGIVDIDVFNFKDYILENDLGETWNSRSPFPLRITYEFEEFMSLAKKQAIEEIIDELKAYARSKNQDVFISFNIGPLFSENLKYGVYDYADFLYGEHFWFDKEHVKGSVAIKLGEGLYKNNYILLLEVKHDHGNLGSGKNLYKHAYADVLSSGKGSLQLNYPKYWTMKNWNYVEGLSYDLDVLDDYNSFMKDNEHLFSLDEPSKIGVVHSMNSRGLKFIPKRESFDYSIDPDKQLITLIDMMLDLNIPFDMIISGNDNVKKRITLDYLNDYELIILPSIVFIEDEEIEALIKYLENGGKVLQINEFGTLANQKLVKETDLLSESENNEWIKKAYGPFEEYLFNNNGYNTLPNKKIKNNVLEDLNKTIKELINIDFESDSNLNVNIRRYVDGNREVFHMVNYDYNHLTDEFYPTPEFKIYLTEETYNNAYFYDVDKNTKNLIEIKDKQIKIPSFDNYGILELKN
jgi:hypothetical protein